MSNNNEPYILWKEEYDDKMYFYVAHKDADGEMHGMKISEPVYLELQQSVNTHRNQKRSDERHKERFDLTEEKLYDRAYIKPKSVADTVVDKIQHELAMKILSEIERRRFTLHEDGYTYEEIAAMGGCTFQAVAKSIKSAKAKMKNFFETQG